MKFEVLTGVRYSRARARRARRRLGRALVARAVGRRRPPSTTCPTEAAALLSGARSGTPCPTPRPPSASATRSSRSARGCPPRTPRRPAAWSSRCSSTPSPRLRWPRPLGAPASSIGRAGPSSRITAPPRPASPTPSAPNTRTTWPSPGPSDLPQRPLAASVRSLGERRRNFVGVVGNRDGAPGLRQISRHLACPAERRHGPTPACARVRRREFNPSTWLNRCLRRPRAGPRRPPREAPGTLAAATDPENSTQA